MATTKSKTFYEILGVPHDASQEEIRQAYLKLARKNHPDKTGGDIPAEEKLKEANEAYDTLKKPEKREEYDRMLRAPSPEEFARGAAGGAAGAEGFGFDFGDDSQYSDLFRHFYGGPNVGGRRAPARGDDVEVEVRVSLRDAAKGGNKTIRVPHRTACATCNGTGAAPGTRPEMCPECRGAGKVSRSAAANFSIVQDCPRCRGTGRIISKPCPTCGGAAEVYERRTLTVNIPAGAQTGTRLRLSGQGDPGELGAASGDLYVEIEVEKDAFFERVRNDVVCEVPVPFTTAILGGTVRVPTLRGRASLKIPAGTQSGRAFRMRAQGLPDLHGGRMGDQLVHIKIQVPTTLSGEAKDLVERLGQMLDASAYAVRSESASGTDGGAS